MPLIKIRKHSVTYLLWIFFYPLVFQFFHVLHHIAEDSNAKVSLTTLWLQHAKDLTKIQNTECPVCSYSFSIKQRAETQDIYIIQTESQFIASIFKPSQITGIRIHSKTSRAPPYPSFLIVI